MLICPGARRERRWHRAAVGVVGELQPTAGLEHAADVGEHRLLVSAQVDYAVLSRTCSRRASAGAERRQVAADGQVVVGEAVLVRVLLDDSTVSVE